MWQGYSRNQAHSTSFHPRGVTPGTWILPLPSASFRKEEDYQLFTTLFSRKTSLNPSFRGSFLLNELKKRAGVDDEKGWLRRLYLQQRKLARFHNIGREHFKEHSRIVFESISNSSSTRLCETKNLLGMLGA